MPPALLPATLHNLHPPSRSTRQPFHLLLNLALGSEASQFTTEGGVGVTEAQLQVRGQG